MRLKKVNFLKNGNRLFAFWANNKGRGIDNCTLQVVTDGTVRPYKSALTVNVISEIKTSSWQGDVNMSKKVCDKLGIAKTDL